MKVELTQKEIKAIKQMTDAMIDSYGAYRLEEVLGEDRDGQLTWLRRFKDKLFRLQP